jgi:hypothetical protein
MRLLKKIYVIKYNNEAFSLNQLYSGGHWSRRSAIKKKYMSLFGDVIDRQKFNKIDKFFMAIFYNTSHDVDNISGMAKIFVDELRSRDIIKNDTPKYYGGFCIVKDYGLKSGEFEFVIISV